MPPAVFGKPSRRGGCASFNRRFFFFFGPSKSCVSRRVVSVIGGGPNVVLCDEKDRLPAALLLGAMVGRYFILWWINKRSHAKNVKARPFGGSIRPVQIAPRTFLSFVHGRVRLSHFISNIKTSTVSFSIPNKENDPRIRIPAILLPTATNINKVRLTQ